MIFAFSFYMHIAVIDLSYDSYRPMYIMCYICSIKASVSRLTEAHGHIDDQRLGTS